MIECKIVKIYFMEAKEMKGDFDFSEISRRKSQAEADSEIRKSSYLISVGLQKKVKMLAIERGVKLNDIMIEALTDILRKYGK